MILDKFFLKHEGWGWGCGVGWGWGQIDIPPGKSNLKKPSLIRVKPTVRNLVRSSFLEAFKVFTVSLYSS